MSAHGDVDLGHTLAGWTGTAIAVAGLSVLGLSVVTVSRRCSCSAPVSASWPVSRPGCCTSPDGASRAAPVPGSSGPGGDGTPGRVGATPAAWDAAPPADDPPPPPPSRPTRWRQ